FSSSPAPPAPHSFPTRRSSDLIIRKLRNTSLLVFENMDRGRIYAALSVDAISISVSSGAIINATSAVVMLGFVFVYIGVLSTTRSEEHTSELQSRENLVCRLLL